MEVLQQNELGVIRSLSMLVEEQRNRGEVEKHMGASQGFSGEVRRQKKSKWGGDAGER